MTRSKEGFSSNRVAHSRPRDVSDQPIERRDGFASISLRQTPQ
jgi:hypothetical protein